MKIIVLGAGGQLGRQLCASLPGAVAGLTRADVDITRPRQLRAVFEQLRPSVVVNAAGFTHVDRAETETEAALAVNADAVGALATLCRDFACTLIHFSSNYVFGADTAHATPYVESDTPGPINQYGKSKLLGEEYVRSVSPRHFILRTCGLYGVSGPVSGRGNFVERILRQADAGRPIRVVCDQVCTPTFVPDLVAGVTQLLPSDAYGTYHVTNAGACSWHEFAEAILRLSQRREVSEAIATETHAAPARRPHYSVLSNLRWGATGFTPLRPWQEALERYLAQRLVSSAGA